MILTPVFLVVDEISRVRRIPVKPLSLERTGFIGLQCEFCGRNYLRFGLESDGVRQVEVNKTGKPGKRDSGTLVWRCWICYANDIQETLDGQKLVIVTSNARSVPKERIKEKINRVVVDNIMREIRYASFWR